MSVEAHVDSFTWSKDSTHILYRLKETSDDECYFFPVKEEVISLDSAVGCGEPVFIHVRTPGSGTIWTANGGLFLLQDFSMQKISSSLALWGSTSLHSELSCLAFGEFEDAHSLVDVGGKHETVDEVEEGLIAVNLAARSDVAIEIASGLDTRIDILSSGKYFTIFETKDEALGPWDMKQNKEGDYVFVAVRSSGISGEPENVWSGVTPRGLKVALSRKLSSHGDWIIGKKLPVSEPFYWTGSDGEALQGIVTCLPDRKNAPLPTVVLPHGGPYSFVHHTMTPPFISEACLQS